MKKRLYAAVVVLGTVIGALSFVPAASATIPASPHAVAVARPVIQTDALVTRTYTVRSGDYLSLIGPHVGRTWEQLAGWNRLSDPNLILPGQVLTIPPASYVPKDLPTSVPVQTAEVAARTEPITTRTEPDAPSIAQAPAQASAQARAAAPAVAPAPVATGGVWGCIAAHESGNTDANTGNGYYGYFQFLPSTFTAVTGLGGLPSDYSYATQLAAAEALQTRAGWGQWPVTSVACGA